MTGAASCAKEKTNEPNVDMSTERHYVDLLALVAMSYVDGLIAVSGPQSRYSELL
jgi:hypothetical protein